MSFRHTPSLVSLLLVLAAAPASAQGSASPVAELGVMLWRTTPELVLVFDSAPENAIDFVREFGFQDDWAPAFRASFGRTHKFRVGYVAFDYAGEALLRTRIRFEGQTFPVGAPAAGAVNWKMWTLGYQWDVVSRPRGTFGIVVDLKYNEVKASIESTALRIGAESDVTAPVPTFGAAGRVVLIPAVEVAGEFTGLKVSTSDFEARFTDLDIHANVMPSRRIGVGAQVGYRSFAIDYDVEGDSGDLQMQGPYVGVVARF